MSRNLDSYLTRLEKYYSDLGDTVSVDRVRKDIVAMNDIRDMEEFRNHPLAKKIYDSAVARFRAAATKLLTQKEMTQEQRNLIFLDMDWAKWYISCLGGDPAKMEEVLEKEVEKQIKILGII